LTASSGGRTISIMARAGTSRRVEQLLARAKDDPVLLEDLVARRSRAALEHGFELAGSEQAMLVLPEEEGRMMESGLMARAVARLTNHESVAFEWCRTKSTRP
jgi:hypothetical protein